MDFPVLHFYIPKIHTQILSFDFPFFIVLQALQSPFLHLYKDLPGGTMVHYHYRYTCSVKLKSEGAVDLSILNEGSIPKI